MDERSPLTRLFSLLNRPQPALRVFLLNIDHVEFTSAVLADQARVYAQDIF
jgi:hypothetical protein